MKKYAVSWSSGKDAAYALLKMQQDHLSKVETLVCTLEQSQKRVSMHGIGEELLDLQSQALNLPLKKIYLPNNISMAEYSAVMKKEFNTLKQEKIDTVIFGDILLQDIKEYREKEMDGVGISASFPLWKLNTQKLAKEIIESGIKTRVVAVSAKVLDESFVGREYDLQFLADLPSGVDPCGENGEFHTFVYDAPNFSFTVNHVVGENVLRSYSKKGNEKEKWETSFWFCNVLPK